MSIPAELIRLEHGAAWSAKSDAIVADQAAPTADANGYEAIGKSVFQIRVTDVGASLTNYSIWVYGQGADGSTDWVVIAKFSDLGADASFKEVVLSGDFPKVAYRILHTAGTVTLKAAYRLL